MNELTSKEFTKQLSFLNAFSDVNTLKSNSILDGTLFIREQKEGDAKKSAKKLSKLSFRSKAESKASLSPEKSGKKRPKRKRKSFLRLSREFPSSAEEVTSAGRFTITKHKSSRRVKHKVVEPAIDGSAILAEGALLSEPVNRVLSTLESLTLNTSTISLSKMTRSSCHSIRSIPQSSFKSLSRTITIEKDIVTKSGRKFTINSTHELTDADATLGAKDIKSRFQLIQSP